jgi:hypothetical protein
MKMKLMLLLFLFSPYGLNAADKLTLKLNLEPEQIYIYTMDVNQTRIQTVDGEKQSLSQEMLEVWNYYVIKHERSGDMNLKLTYKRVKVSQNYDDQNTAFDSDNPPEYLDPSMKGLSTMPGTVLMVRMTSDGKVAKIEGVDAMLDKMIAAMALPDSGQKKAVIADLRKQWGTEALKQSIEQITSFYPESPIVVGDKWNNSFDITSGGLPMHISSQYTYNSDSSGIAIIDAASDISSDSASSAVKMGLLTMAYQINGTQTGTIEVDEVTGLPSKSKLDMHYDGTVTVSGVPDEPAQSWPISADGTVLVTFVRQ